MLWSYNLNFSPLLERYNYRQGTLTVQLNIKLKLLFVHVEYETVEVCRRQEMILKLQLREQKFYKNMLTSQLLKLMKFIQS